MKIPSFKVEKNDDGTYEFTVWLRTCEAIKGSGFDTAEECQTEAQEKLELYKADYEQVYNAALQAILTDEN